MSNQRRGSILAVFRCQLGHNSGGHLTISLSVFEKNLPLICHFNFVGHVVVIRCGRGMLFSSKVFQNVFGQAWMYLLSSLNMYFIARLPKELGPLSGLRI